LAASDNYHKAIFLLSLILFLGRHGMGIAYREVTYMGLLSGS
jgi:hypothetical protein